MEICNSHRIPNRLHRLQELEIISPSELSKSAIKNIKYCTVLSVDNYNIYPRLFVPNIKRIYSVVKTCQKLNLMITSAGVNPTINLKKSIRKLKNFKSLKELDLYCATLTAIKKRDMEEFVKMLKPLRDLRGLHLNFLETALSTDSLNVFYGFHALPKLSSLVLKLPSRRYIKETKEMTLEKIHKKCREFGAYKKSLKELEFTVKHEDDLDDIDLFTQSYFTSRDYNYYIDLLKELKHIENLKLHFCKRIRPETFDILIQNLRELKSVKRLALKLNNDKLDIEHIIGILETIKDVGLQHFELGIILNQNVSSVLHDCLIHLSQLKTLKLHIQDSGSDSKCLDATVSSLHHMTNLEHFSIKWMYAYEKPIDSFYLGILANLEPASIHKLKTFEIYYPKGILTENEFTNLLPVIENMKNLRVFGLGAKAVKDDVSEALLRRFFKSLSGLENLDKLVLEFRFNPSKEVIKELMSSLHKLKDITKVGLYCPYGVETMDSIREYFEQLISCKTLKRIRMNFPYSEELKAIIRPNSRKAFVKSIFWDTSYRIVYDIYTNFGTVF